MKHRKKLMILLTLTACMVLFCSFPVFAAELTEAQVEHRKCLCLVPLCHCLFKGFAEN